jgi:hypothetical protein
VGACRAEGHGVGRGEAHGTGVEAASAHPGLPPDATGDPVVFAKLHGNLDIAITSSWGWQCRDCRVALRTRRGRPLRRGEGPGGRLPRRRSWPDATGDPVVFAKLHGNLDIAITSSWGPYRGSLTRDTPGTLARPHHSLPQQTHPHPSGPC